MSTFNGYVKEFPTIRIDHFRKTVENPHPVVGFISHVHSDHLQGLESWGRIPLYCSPSTQQLLLHLETYSHRMNFAKGILESRKQHYKHLKSVLKPVPLNTPTEIEIGLGQFIRVTLFDANHCAGAVMFLIEDEQKAVLYTGDIRSEPWWINSLARNPAILLYSSGIKRLDNMYLDTTFATNNKQFRSFKSKAAGIKELLEKMLKFPKETVFHFNAWTLGYEDVWVAMSGALNTQVHVDDYKRTLYKSLALQGSSHLQCPEAPNLVGFMNGNHFQKGCLTEDRSVRLHSCEYGTGCPALRSSETIHINPIVSKDENGEILPEAGAGRGGHHFLYNHAFLELNETGSIELLLEICNTKVEDLALRSKIRDMIIRAAKTNDQAILLSNVALQDAEGNIETGELVKALVERARFSTDDSILTDEDPRQIRFSYSRHSSYEELCMLVATFRPRDIYPCTANWQEWSPASSIENLFGHLCDMLLAHDQEMASMEIQREMLQSKKRPRPVSDSPKRHISHEDGVKKSHVSDHSCEPNHSFGLRTLPLLNGQSSHADHEQTTAELRRAFEYQFKSVKSKMKPSTPNSKLCFNADGTGAVPNSALHFSVGRHAAGAQTGRNEICDDTSTKFNSQVQGDFLLKEIPAPEEIVTPDVNEEAKKGSQLTLSDSYFESQIVDLLPEEHAAKLQDRQQAYKAVRNLDSTWEEEHFLVSSGVDHGEAEVEL